MKKTLTFVILSLVTVSLFSGYYNYLSGSNISTSQTSTMTVVIEATSDILNCGISSTFDPSKSDLGLTDLSTKSFDPVINTTSQNWSYKGKIDELYVWWQIYSSNKYDVTITLSTLKDVATKKIVIPYSVNIYTLDSNSNYVSGEEIYIEKNDKNETVYNYTSTGSIESGHRKLSFLTDEARGIEVANSFQATLTVKVSSV